MSYDFLAPPQVHFGWGRRREAGRLAASLGNRAFVIVGSRTLQETRHIAEILDRLHGQQIETIPLATAVAEPHIAEVDLVAAAMRKQVPRDGDFVLAIGGGSAIDLAKAVAAMGACEAADVADYLEGVGEGYPIVERPFPIMAMPTTGGTGSEATKNAVITCYDPPFKKSLRHPWLIPQVVLIDPELAVSLPPTITAHTGLDAITQLIESYISCRAKPIPQSLALGAMEGVIPALREAVADGGSRPAREKMAHVAFVSGLALANSGLGFAHGVAAALGSHCRVPHGLACAVMLPVALGLNRRVATPQMARLATAVTGQVFTNAETGADALITAIERLLSDLDIPPRLSDLGVRGEHLPAIAQASRGNSMDGNPRRLTDREIFDSLHSIL